MNGSFNVRKKVRGFCVLKLNCISARNAWSKVGKEVNIEFCISYKNYTTDSCANHRTFVPITAYIYTLVTKPRTSSPSPGCMNPPDLWVGARHNTITLC